MSIMQQSSKAEDQTLGVWFQNIEQGRVKLPRFQRPGNAWDRGRVTSFLNTIISNLPIGVTLVLDVAGDEKFISRYIKTAVPASPTAVTQHLLDGQQRLTSFWRAMHNNFEKETYFVYSPQFDMQADDSTPEVEIRCIPRWLNKNDLRMPRWVEEPSHCLERGLIPVSLLRPGDISQEIEVWLKDATQHLEPTDSDPDALNKFKKYSAVREQIKTELTNLRERVAHFNFPFLSLPANTSKDVALQVFINMNTNSKPLALYDIIVAEVESVAGKSLQDMADQLEADCPKVVRYGAIQDLILSTSALLQDRLPNNRGMIEMDKQRLLKNWPALTRGLRKMADFLEEQGVFDEARLPTNAVLAVIAAAFESIPDDGDFSAKGEMLLRRYLWSSFCTDRYENAAATRAYADFKAMKTLLVRQDFIEADLVSVPVLDRDEYSLPEVGALRAAGWPKARGIEARAILCVTTYLGALDFADGKKATYENVQKREYHHVFPDALLREAEIESNLALNCALITWKTNRIIGRKDPLEYLKERVKWAEESVVESRLKTHLISFSGLSKAHYSGLEGEALKEKLAPDFGNFLTDRANLIAEAIRALTSGEEPTVDALWAASLQTKGAGE